MDSAPLRSGITVHQVGVALPPPCGEGGPPPLRLHGIDSHKFSREHFLLLQGGHYGIGDPRGPLLGTCLDGSMEKAVGFKS